MSPAHEPSALGVPRVAPPRLDGMSEQPQEADPTEGSAVKDVAERTRSVAEQVEQPAKVMRIATMIQKLLEEQRSAPLDEASRRRLAELHTQSITELRQGLSPEVGDELARLSKPFATDGTPTDDELRIGQAQLVGWLEGLFQGIQTALVAQQMAARARQGVPGQRELPGQPGQVPTPFQPGPQGGNQGGMYL